MSATVRRLLALVLLLAAAWLAIAWLGSDRRQIGRRVARLQDLVGRRPGESSLAGLNRARRITELFAPSFVFRATPYGFEASDRQSLTAGIHAYRSRAASLTMRIRDRELTIDPALRRATLYLTAEFVRGLGGDRDTYRFQVNWIKGEEGWQIDYVDLLEVIEGDPGRVGF